MNLNPFWVALALFAALFVLSGTLGGQDGEDDE